MKVREHIGVFKECLRRKGLKSTAQRDDIARVFFGTGGHVSVEELCREVRKVNPRVGYATVYRTVKLLRDCGLAAERHFHDAEARYEKTDADAHHDHLICERCGRIVEFEQRQMAALREQVARRFGYVITRHRVELYGLCRSCRAGRRGGGRR